MARPEVAGSGTSRHGCGRDDNDGRRGEPPCDGPPPWRWSSFSIAAIWTRLAAPWTRLAAAWSVCRRRRLLALTRKERTYLVRHGHGGGTPPLPADPIFDAMANNIPLEDLLGLQIFGCRTRSFLGLQEEKEVEWWMQNLYPSCSRRSHRLLENWAALTQACGPQGPGGCAGEPDIQIFGSRRRSFLGIQEEESYRLLFFKKLEVQVNDLLYMFVVRPNFLGIWMYC